MILKEIQYSTAEDLFHAFAYNGELYNLIHKGFIFRGHSYHHYKLLPTVLREDAMTKLFQSPGKEKQLGVLSLYENAIVLAEYTILSEFYNIADNAGLKLPEVKVEFELFNQPLAKVLLSCDSWLPDELCDLAGIAQHYGLPTRLLDWSKDVNVSLYFSAKGVVQSYLRDVHDIRIQRQKALQMVRHSFGQQVDVANDEKYAVLWALDINRLEMLKLAHKDFPLKFVKPQYSGNPNLNAQQGLFTLWQIPNLAHELMDQMDSSLDLSRLNLVDNTPLDEKICEYFKDETQIVEPLIYKVLYPHSIAGNVLEHLYCVGYDSSRIFPGYQGAANAVLDKKELDHYKTLQLL